MDGNKKPVRRRRRRGLETLKSLLIVLLALNAVYLTLVALDHSRVSWGPLEGVLSLVRPEQEGDPEAPASVGQPSFAPRPVRAAVCDGTDRFLCQYDDQQTDALFERLSILLGEALASAAPPRAVDEAQWRQALESPGAWFDFLGAVPLESLRAWLGDSGGAAASDHAARRMAVALDGDGAVRLYYQNEGDGRFYACATSVVYQGHMDALLEGQGGNGCAFVFEAEADSGYQGLDPYTLLAPEALHPPVYRASNPLADIDDARVTALQQAVSFQPQSNSVYPVANGIRIREGRETLEIGNDGVAVYHGGGEAARYPIGGDGGPLALAEATWQLAAGTVGRWCGAARLYLIGTEYLADGTVQVRYGYTLNGADVSLPGGGCAALFTVSQGQITDYTLRFRRYEQTGQTGLVLRERQAAAALDALQSEGRELILAYGDNGGDAVRAGWTAR